MGKINNLHLYNNEKIIVDAIISRFGKDKNKNTTVLLTELKISGKKTLLADHAWIYPPDINFKTNFKKGECITFKAKIDWYFSEVKGDYKRKYQLVDIEKVVKNKHCVV